MLLGTKIWEMGGKASQQHGRGFAPVGSPLMFSPLHFCCLSFSLQPFRGPEGTEKLWLPVEPTVHLSSRYKPRGRENTPPRGPPAGQDSNVDVGSDAWRSLLSPTLESANHHVFQLRCGVKGVVTTYED